MSIAFSNIIPLFVAIIGIIAASVPVLLDTLMNHFYNRPNINIEILPTSSIDDQKAEISIANTGQTIANNVSVGILAPKEILTITAKSLLNNIRLIESNKTLQYNRSIA